MKLWLNAFAKDKDNNGLAFIDGSLFLPLSVSVGSLVSVTLVLYRCHQMGPHLPLSIQPHRAG